MSNPDGELVDSGEDREVVAGAAAELQQDTRGPPEPGCDRADEVRGIAGPEPESRGGTAASMGVGSDRRWRGLGEGQRSSHGGLCRCQALARKGAKWTEISGHSAASKALVDYG